MNKTKLKWIVYYYSCNKNEIKTFNVFDHKNFSRDVGNYLKKCKDKNEFSDHLKRALLYYFWSKYEWELIITQFTPRITIAELDRLNRERESHVKAYNRDYVTISVNLDTEIKIDVYMQIMNNWDIFVDYVWNSKVH